MKNKKGIEMSMNVIIIAVIVLIVLAIIAYLLVSRLGLFRGKLECVDNYNGQCLPIGSCNNPLGNSGEKGCAKGFVCCPLTS
ncbi:MAG: hypothetical protein QXG00_00285 [Candidatus Woesearchaeota archaeon]